MVGPFVTVRHGPGVRTAPVVVPRAFSDRDRVQ